MALSEIAAVAVFVAVVLFGIVDTIRTPLIIKRFYRDRNFSVGGETRLSDCSGARIVDGMYTDRPYKNESTGVSQYQAWSTDRRKFTLSKAARKRNRAPWSVTVVEGDFEKTTCLFLPSVVPEAIAYIGNGENIDFEHDLQIANRYHITAGDEALIKSVVAGDVRKFLLQPDVIFIESTDSELVIKRTWANHQVLERLEQELSIAAKLRERLGK